MTHKHDHFFPPSQKLFPAARRIQLQLKSCEAQRERERATPLFVLGGIYVSGSPGNRELVSEGPEPSTTHYNRASTVHKTDLN